MVDFKQSLVEGGSADGAVTEACSPGNPSVRRRFWSGIRRAGLVTVSSAALGGIALALWNRKTLNEMRRQEEQRGAE